MRYEWDRRGQVTGDSRPIARIRDARLRGWAEARVGPVVWHYRVRDGERIAVRGHDTEPTYVAKNVSVKPPCWEVVDGSHVLTVTGDSLSHWMTVSRDGQPVGRTGAARSCSTRPCLEIDPPQAPELAVFLLWVRHVATARGGAG